MGDSSYQRLRKALSEARARGESDQAVIATLVRVVPADVLKALYREAVRENRSDLSAAIERSLFEPSDFRATLPPQDAETAKAAQGDTLEAAIAGAFARKSSPTRKTVTNIPSADGPRHGRIGGKR